MTTTMTPEVRATTTWSIALSVLMMAAGVLAIAIPPIAGLTVTVIFGWLLIAAGLLHLGFAWRGDRIATVIGEIALAVLCAVTGFYIVARPIAGLASLTIAIAAWLVLKGVLEGAIAYTLRPLPGSGWLLFDAILTVALAAMIGATWPASSAWAVGMLVGVAMFSSGVARMQVSIAVRRVLG